ncbi:hypothetical protein LQW54_011956 [Pestalotiopsis sp. IQ-011]
MCDTPLIYTRTILGHPIATHHIKNIRDITNATDSEMKPVALMTALLATSLLATALPAYNTTNDMLATGEAMWSIGVMGTGEVHASGNLSTVMHMLRIKGMLHDQGAPALNVSAISAHLQALRSHLRRLKFFYLDPWACGMLIKDIGEICKYFQVRRHHWISGVLLDARISVCSFAGLNPCEQAEMQRAFDRIDDQCPKNDQGQLASGSWYESDWEKAYEHISCRLDMICKGMVYLPCAGSGYSPDDHGIPTGTNR